MQRHAFVALILSGLLLYGGLFPLHGWHAGNAIAFLTEHHPVPTGLDDLLVNVLIFVPLGFASLLALNQRYRPGRSAWLALVHGFVLSFCIETFQAFLPQRYSSLADLATNTLGTALGAGAALWYATHGRRVSSQAAPHVLGDARARVVLAACAAWASAPLLPFNPVTTLEALYQRLDLLATALRGSHPWSLGLMGVNALALFALARLWHAAGLPARWQHVALLVPVLARVILGDQGLRAEEFVGALLGLGLVWALPVRSTPAAAAQAGCALLVCFVLTEALPGSGAAYRTFNWIPFKAHLQDPLLGVEDLLGVVWIALGLAASVAVLSPAGRWPLALAVTLALSATAFVLELHQLRLPGRTPDVTQTLVLALTSLLTFAALGMLRGGRAAS